MTAMPTMIERVAWGIAAELVKDETLNIEAPEAGEAGEFIINGRVDMRTIARAAIGAMVEPTPEMCASGHRFQWTDDIYSAMISAALRETQDEDGTRPTTSHA